MRVSSSLLFASRLLFPRTGKKSNARRSLVGATFCIGISLVPLVMVLTVSNGMIEGITERIIGLSSSHLSCVFKSADAQTLREMAEKLRGVDGVVGAQPEVQGTGLAASRMGRTGATIRGVERDIFTSNRSFSSLFKVVAGETSLSDDKSAVVGANLAEKLGVGVGDQLRLITVRSGAGGKVLPKVTSFVISGIVSSGYQELDALWVFVPFESAFGILSPRSSRFSVGVETEDAFGIAFERIASRVEGAVPQSVMVYRWSELHSAEFENFSSTRIMLLFIMMLIVLVASVNISSALVMLVMERRKEIAILKSLGGSSSGIALSFLVTGMMSGLLGVLFGIPVGLLCAVNFNPIMGATEHLVNILAHFASALVHGSAGGISDIRLLDPAYYLQDIPLSVPLAQLVVIGSGTLVLSLLMSAWPALKAGSEKPIETLRKI
ncbi:ABC transporter permease [Treponema saccharophilum]|uniref:ABC3 transporter permease protein domain-containing protein n=1 Tax=Treponema saccharophilum DSM 2985 TaxID=907348 RepID=H7ELE4_9SPIR|nr:ABC transporter permease [Treponema saccharophilum]EIC01485.1 protein of unknown function DUF214 [Treponema saccharophilum DSM 2985]BDC95609.1 ABC transporter substrate-binding protein [Treponema saccharophilum]